MDNNESSFERQAIASELKIKNDPRLNAGVWGPSSSVSDPAFRMGPKAQARIALSDSAIRRALEAIVDLSALEESLLFRVCCLSLLRGYAWISQAHLAELMRCSERSVRDATKAVCELGLLTTTRTRDGLRYFPQWESLGLDSVSKVSQPAAFAGLDRQTLPVHHRSTIRSDKEDSSSARAAPRAPTAAAFPLSRAKRAETTTAEPPSAKPQPDAPELGAVLDKFGPQAAQDVREVLASRPVRDNPTAQRAALERLLLLHPGDIRTSPGACFRRFAHLACEGRLAAPLSAPSSGAQGRHSASKPLTDPLVDRIRGLRDRLSLMAAAHPHRAKCTAELFDLEHELAQRQSHQERLS